MKRVLILGVVVNLIFNVFNSYQSAAWFIETVDDPKTFRKMTDKSIAITDEGFIHIAYGGDHLYYAYYDGSTWHYETVDSSVDVGEYTSLALDSQDKVHISYYDDVNNVLKYATNATGLWVKETVDSDGGYSTSLALDSQDKVHISYRGDVTMPFLLDSDLKYATNATGSWVIETVEESPGSLLLYISLGIDSQDKVHISYYDETNEDLKYATNSTGSWVTETVENIVHAEYISLGIDSQDKVHISYYDETNEDLKYATNTSGSWVTETLDSVGDVGYYTSLAIDSQDKVHISYYDGWPNFDLKYASNATGSWVTETVDSTRYVGSYTSLDLDSQDKVHISYYDESHHDLKYARQCDVQSTTTPTTTPTTTTTTPKCPYKKIYGEDSEEVELLRYIRDNVLSQTPEGKELIRLYYQLSPVIVKAMEGDDGFKEDVREMIDGVLGLITEETE